MTNEAKILRVVRRILNTPEGESVTERAAEVMDQLDGYVDEIRADERERIAQKFHELGQPLEAATVRGLT